MISPSTAAAGTVGREGSRLCLSCGLCCQGTLHRAAHVADDEIESVQRLGLKVVASEDGPVFPLPCPLHRGAQCTVYTERPSVCRTYQCKLLRRFLAGEATWDECIGLVHLAQDLVSRIARRRGAAIVDREILIDTAALSIHCKKHFLNRAQPKAILGP